MKPILAGLAAAAASLFLLAPEPASARIYGGPIQAAPVVELAQQRCTVRRVRTVRPNGRVVVREIRDCGPRARVERRDRFERCRVERRRVVRPDGRVINRTVRVCR
jgi:hypothetical protein